MFEIIDINILKDSRCSTAAAVLKIQLIWYNYHGRPEVGDVAARCIEVVDLSVCDLHVASPQTNRPVDSRCNRQRCSTGAIVGIRKTIDQTPIRRIRAIQ